MPMANQEIVIPNSIEDFDLYIRRTNHYLISGSPINALRFSWTETELITWQDFRNEWIPLYAQYTDENGAYTDLVKEQLLAIIAACIALCENNKLFKKIESHAAVCIEDVQMFNLPASV